MKNKDSSNKLFLLKAFFLKLNALLFFFTYPNSIDYVTSHHKIEEVEFVCLESHKYEVAKITEVCCFTVFAVFDHIVIFGVTYNLHSGLCSTTNWLCLVNLTSWIVFYK